MKKYVFFFSILLSGITFTYIGCSDDATTKVDNTAITDDVIEARQKSFYETIAKIREMYPQDNTTELRNPTIPTNGECGPDGDPTVNCPPAASLLITMVVPATGTVYHPLLPPMGCDLKIRMKLRFCTSANPMPPPPTNSVIIFEDFEILGYVNPLSSPCLSWGLSLYYNLTSAEQNDVFRAFLDDYQAAFEYQFMSLWAASHLNEFKKCPPENAPCPLSGHAVQAKYYRASCSKVCLVFETECTDPWYFLCRKTVPCYTDGCCKKETTYCLNGSTNEVEVCHQAYYLLGSCTKPASGEDCVIELEECSDIPRCPQEG
ncbi:MAG: hypothetical protein LC107_08740 [Chitinophagales bacterium]|nr:hypothetical protein [Chitinophagales bacterium]